MVKKVLIVDDSAMIRELLTELISSFSEYEVVGAAADPIKAVEMIASSSPDIITLDIQMPKMDGLTFLEKIMRLRPVPVLMISCLTEKNSEIALKSLELGAIDYIEKPQISIKEGLLALSTEIKDKLDMCKEANIHSQVKKKLIVTKKYTADEILIKKLPKQLSTHDKIIAIGASTGGTVAILELLKKLPLKTPGIVITQHMPNSFTKSFAKRLNDQCLIEVKEAQEGDQVIPGVALIAPGGKHLLLKRDGTSYSVTLKEGNPVNRHIPSVDVLFRSVAQEAGQNAIGIILTGMGDDGARGLLEMRESGAYTIAQDEQSSIVFGMPKVAIQMGSAEEVLSLNSIFNLIKSLNIK